MKILVTGSQSSGTKMVARLLQSAGASAQHWSVPIGSDWVFPPPGETYDAVVLVVRTGPCCTRSLVDTHDPENLQKARVQQRDAMKMILMKIPSWIIYVVTYESIVYEGDKAMRLLFKDLGLPNDLPLAYYSELARVDNANKKWYNGRYFRDKRLAHPGNWEEPEEKA